jgi:hypothetical protein
MKIYLLTEFLNDLKGPADSGLLRQVLKHTIDDHGDFISDGDDHQYQGIEKAWIRRISKGFRVIYLKYGDSIYLYRAGTHSVEDRLIPPQDLSGTAIDTFVPKLSSDINKVNIDLGCLLKTTEPVFLNKEILSSYHVGHHEIILVSPFLDLEIFHRHHHFGSFLDRAVEDGTEITLVTKPPNTEYLNVYKDLEQRTIFVYFLEGLHTKLYIFNVDTTKTPQYNKSAKSKIIVGSANLTKSGFGLDDDHSNYELCYSLPVEKYAEAYDYAKKLIYKAMDFRTFELKTRR